MDKHNILLIRPVTVLLVTICSVDMTKTPKRTWEQLKSKLNVEFAEVNDSHYAFTMSPKAKQDNNDTE